MPTHDQQILDQFTRQASLFQAGHLSAEDVIATTLAVSGVTAADDVLDVACGPGVLSCAFARVARRVVGIDITPTMLAQARKLQAASALDNVTWQACDVYAMPFDADSFPLIVTRYAFHHFEAPERVLREMVRVCKPGGRVVIIDSAPPAEKAPAFDAIEKRRDPSHTRALPPEAIARLVEAAGLAIARRHPYAWEVTADSLLARSFPVDDDRAGVKAAYEADVGRDALAMNARHVDGVLHVTFPTLITVARKPIRG